MDNVEHKGGEPMFAMLAEEYYSDAQVSAVLNAAAKAGFPLETGSFVESMTIRQLDGCLKGQFDA